jgi:hypothetical protein
MPRTKPSPGGKAALRAQQERSTPVSPKEARTGRPSKSAKLEKRRPKPKGHD